MFRNFMIDDRVPTLGDLERLSYEVGISCDACHRTVTYTVAELIGRHGRNVRPLEIGKRMRCVGCARRGVTASLRVLAHARAARGDIAAT